ncbi:DnaA ATPase domain-containing protein [Streptomyces sp. NPDC101227]|uniref:DnaA ATPase domain-containing protein n=1 Tax=Streptomyces sp. NPDC101227 TaxID=3366136 RepID=UPI0038117FFC
MGSLEPLGSDLPYEAGELAAALRSLFGALEVSVRRYGARRHRDAGSISRFLNGTRIPVWEFVADLLTDVAEQRGTAATPDMVEHLRGLHRRALAAGGFPAHRVQLLEAQLADADRSARRSVVRERAIEDALLDTQHRVAGLELQLRQLESAEVRDPFGASLVPGIHEDPLDSLDALRKERDELRYQVADLSEELKDAHARRIRAERRCNELERQLVMAEQGARADVESQDRQEERREAGREERVRTARMEALEEELRRLRSRVASLDHKDVPAEPVTTGLPGPAGPPADAAGGRTGGAPRISARPRRPGPVAKTAPDHAYRFENFAAEASNRFAHDVAVAVAEAPAQDYNPLLIHGAPGLGKTHLLHAIGHYACTLYPETRSQYVGCRQLVAFLRSERPGSAFGAFHRRFGTVDILLVDDVRWPAESGASQDLLAEVLAELLTADKQIVLASGPSLARMPHLEGGLRDCLERGLDIGVEVPSARARLAILRKKTEKERLDVPMDVLEMIAARVGRNIRELEGALVRVTAFANLNRSPVDTGLTKIVLDSLQPGGGSDITGEAVIRKTGDYFGLSVEDLRSTERSRVLVTARQIAMYLCRELTGYSVPTIAALLGGRDPGAVLHADRKIRALMSERRSIYNQVTELTNGILFP